MVRRIPRTIVRTMPHKTVHMIFLNNHTNNPLLQDDRSHNFPHGRSFNQPRTRSSAEFQQRSFTQSAARSFTRGLYCFYTIMHTPPYVHDRSQNNLPTRLCEQCSARSFAGSFTQPLTRVPLRSFTQPLRRVPLHNHRSNNPPGYIARCPELSFAEAATQDRSKNNPLRDFRRIRHTILRTIMRRITHTKK